MTRHVRFVVPFLILILAATPAAMADDSAPTLSATVTADSVGKMTLDVAGSVRGRTAWLEVALRGVAAGAKPAIERASVFSVSGDFRVPVPLAQELVGGSYDIALWARRESEPASSRPAWLKAYGSGTIAGGPGSGRVADSLALLQTSVATIDGRRILRVAGTARADRWLVVTFRDGRLDADSASGSEVLLHVGKGDFAFSVGVPVACERGSYEAALWAKMVHMSGYSRFDGELARATGGLPGD